MANPKYKEWLEPDGLLLLKGWARQGLTDEEIAQNMGIVPSTLYIWLKEHKEISKAIKEGRKPVIIEVEDTFIEKKLKGYYVEEEVEEITQHPDGGQTKHKRKTKRYIPPDTTAMIFYLKCRLANIYNDRLAVQFNTNNGQLADLIEGLKNNVYAETTEIDEPMAEE